MLLLDSGDDRFNRVHRILCKLNKMQMATLPGQRIGTAHRLPAPPGGTFTHRDQANVLTLLAFRNGPIEDLHAGKSSELLENPELSRITDDEMKALMLNACEYVAKLLELKESDPEAYYRQMLVYNRTHCRGWER